MFAIVDFRYFLLTAGACAADHAGRFGACEIRSVRLSPERIHPCHRPGICAIRCMSGMPSRACAERSRHNQFKANSVGLFGPETYIEPESFDAGTAREMTALLQSMKHETQRRARVDLGLGEPGICVVHVALVVFST